MGLINQDNRVKRDLTGTRTSEDVMRRLAKNVQITTDEVKGLTVEVKGKVDGKDIISTINQSAEAVTIDANKININGTISANGNFKVDTSGNMLCNNATINGAAIVNGSKFSVDTNGKMTCNDATINGGSINLQGGEYVSKIKIDSTDSNGWAEFGSHELTLNDGNDNGFHSSVYSTSALMFYRYGSSYIQCTFNDTMPQYNDITILCNGTAGRTTNITSSSSMVFRPKYISADVTESDGLFYVKINHRTLIEASYTGVYIYNSSLEEYKKNIEEFKNALDIIKNTDIYKFNYKNENDDKKPHIGVIIGENRKTPTEMLNNDNDGADFNNMTSICIQAIKEQQEQIEKLKLEIEELRKLVNK